MSNKPQSNHKQVINLVKSLTGQANVLTIPRIFVDYTGSLDAALFLSQFLYWSDKGDKEGWFYKTYTEWQAELCLGEYEVRKSIKLLRDTKEVIETKIKKANGSPTLHFRLKTVEFSDSFLEFLQERKSTNSRNESLETELSITETTQQTTTEKRDRLDFLDHIVSLQGQVSESTAPNPDDQWFEYSSKIVKDYHTKMGYYPGEIEKSALVELAGEPGFNWQKWQDCLNESVLNWSGKGKCPLARIIEVYRAGNYAAWKDKTYPTEQQQATPKHQKSITNIDMDYYQQLLAEEQKRNGTP